MLGWVFQYLLQNAFEIKFFLLHIFDLLRDGCLALDRHGACVTQLMQFGEDQFEVDQTLADDNLFAKLRWVGRPPAVLRVNALYVWADDVYSVYWICLAVEDQVRSVQTHAQIWLVDIFDGSQQRARRLLPCLHQKGLTIAGAVRCKLANRMYCVFIEGVLRILWDETAMRLHVSNTKHLCEIRRLLERVHPCCSRCLWNYSDSLRSIYNVPLQRPRANHLCCGRCKFVFMQQPLQILRKLFGELADVIV